MIYQEQEVGSYAYFRNLFWARRRVPELRRGSADYLSVETAPEIFSVLRSLDQIDAVGLVNLSPQQISTRVRLPAQLSLPVSQTLIEVITGQSVTATQGQFHWTFAPYATAVFRQSQQPLEDIPPESHKAVTADCQSHSQFTWQGTGGDIRFAYGTVTGRITSPDSCNCSPLPDGCVRVTLSSDQSAPQSPSIQFTGVEHWRVQSVTGDYADHLLRRHYPWPENRFPWEPNQVWGHEPHSLYRGVLPLGRVWQSAVAPLADAGVICLAGSSGNGLVLRDIVSTGENIVLADSAADPALPASGMSLLFMGSDPALNPLWLPPWQSAGWLIVVPTKSQTLTSEFTFTLGPLENDERKYPASSLAIGNRRPRTYDWARQTSPLRGSPLAGGCQYRGVSSCLS